MINRQDDHKIVDKFLDVCIIQIEENLRKLTPKNLILEPVNHQYVHRNYCYKDYHLYIYKQ